MSDRRKKVVRLLPVLDFGGVESRVTLQSSLMDHERFELRVCTFWKPGQAAEAIREMGVPVDVLDVDPSVRNPRATLKLWAYLAQQKPDVLHASIAEAMFHGAIASWLAKTPLSIIEDTGVPARSTAGNLAYATISRLVDVVIGVSQATCDYLLTEDRMPRDRVELLYNCGNPRFFNERTRGYKRSGPLRLFTAGRLVPVKNHETLLRAVAHLVHEEERDITLDIAGDGGLREDLSSLIEQLDLAEHVTLLGFRTDVRELLDAHDVFVIPSHSEGCSVALLEAMATGIPPLGSTASGVREGMGELGDEYLTDSRDLQGWIDVLRTAHGWSDADREEIGSAAREIAHRRFSPARYIGALHDLYDRAPRRK